MDPLDAIGSGELREALLFVRMSAAPVTADDAAAALGVHRTVARDRLERLHRAGLVTAAFARRSGRTGPGAGRPAKLYAAAPESRALEFPPRRLPELFSRVIDQLPGRKRERLLRRAGEAFGRDLAAELGLESVGSTEDGLEQVCDAMRTLGFQASLVEVHDKTAVISTPTCPLRPLVAARAEAAHIDRGMWAGLVECAVRDARAGDVECETDACLDDSAACSVVIRLRR